MPFLDWVNKNQAVQTSNQVPYHLLQHQGTYGDTAAAHDNLLIQGDNLQALKALLPFYTGKVKCIFIDPPYNTQSAFEHYDDKLEHSQWLSMMYPRLVLLRELLAEDGSIWVTLDDREAHYFKVMMDEVFGRGNFVANVLWQKVYSERMDSVGFSAEHDHLLCYSKGSHFNVKRLAKSQNLSQFKFKDERTGMPYRRRSLRKEGSESLRIDRPSMWYSITAPDGSEVYPIKPDGTEGRWRWMPETYQRDFEQTEFVKVKGKWEIYVKQFFDDKSDRPPSTLWFSEDVGHNHEAKLEAQSFNKISTFTTPKPERLIQRILHIATNENDLILDSFLGSGTTAAVAHKMNRRYIGIEMGEHAVTHCIPRLQKVIEGEQGGISKAVNWQGGGGFNFFTLGAPVFDADGHITPEVRFADLAAYIWWLETKSAQTSAANSATSSSHQTNTPFIGEHEGVAYYLLYNGILGDRRPNGGNVLTSAVLAHLLEVHPHAGKKVIFGEASRLGDARLAENQIEFKQIPYELHDRV